MPKGSIELTSARENEIIDACAALYETMSFKEITIKDIGNATSFARTSIYNYFQTKEEIFLALLKREYALWNTELAKASDTKTDMSREELAALLAQTLSKKERLLRLLSMNLFAIEENSRADKLTEFKTEFKKSLDIVNDCLNKITPEMTNEEKHAFLYSFFPFMHGIYPYTAPTQKQLYAMQQAGVDFQPLSIYKMTYATLKKLLSV